VLDQIEVGIRSWVEDHSTDNSHISEEMVGATGDPLVRPEANAGRAKSRTRTTADYLSS
jgi:hypothetical protein